MRKKVKIALVLLTVIAIVGFTVFNSHKAMDVEATEVLKGDLDEYIEETAIVKMENEISVYALETGVITNIFVEVGKNVKSGDNLAQIDDKGIILQIKGLQAQKQSISSQFQEAIKPANKETINKLEAQLTKAEVVYNNAKRTAESSKKLYEDGAISNDAYQQALANLTVSEAQLQGARSDLNLAKKGPSEEVRNQYEGQLNELQAQIDLMEKRKTDLFIVSPINGAVMTKDISIGSYVQPGTLLFTLGNEEVVYLETDILTDEVRGIKVGSPVMITNDNFDIGEIKGTVRKIHPKAFSKVSDLGIEQKRVKVEIAIENLNEEIRPGYDMDIKIITNQRKEVLHIDEKALFEFQGKDYVFVNQDGKAALREVEVGISSGDRVEILKGLEEGEAVVLSPDKELEEGMKIE